MRYLDLAVATMIGMSSVTALVVLSPSPFDAAADRQASNLVVRDDLLGYLRGQGAAWLSSAPPQEVCQSIARASSSAVSFDAVIDNDPCGVAPYGVMVVNLTLAFSERTVILEAWSTGEG
jgi:hypothetical protein